MEEHDGEEADDADSTTDVLEVHLVAAILGDIPIGTKLENTLNQKIMLKKK